MSNTYFIRLKPFNKRRGHLVRNYLWRGQRFTTRWVEVSAAVAEQLATHMQPHDLEAEIPLFDIKTPSDARKLAESERDEKTGVDAALNVPKLPDRSFREPPKPEYNDATGEIEEPTFDFSDDDSEDQPEPDPEPAPSLKKTRSRKGRARTRKE